MIPRGLSRRFVPFDRKPPELSPSRKTRKSRGFLLVTNEASAPFPVSQAPNGAPIFGDSFGGALD
jgi:hypothetical protein